MEDFEMQSKLIYSAVAGEVNTYSYYVRTKIVASQANYRAGGQPSITHQNDGTIDVELHVIEDATLPDIYLETPIVHTVDIGIFQPTTYHHVNVSVILVGDSINNTIGDDVLSTAEAMEESKPIEIDGS